MTLRRIGFALLLVLIPAAAQPPAVTRKPAETAADF